MIEATPPDGAERNDRIIPVQPEFLFQARYKVLDATLWVVDFSRRPSRDRRMPVEQLYDLSHGPAILQRHVAG